jgi:hypothetical protein
MPPLAGTKGTRIKTHQTRLGPPCALCATHTFSARAGAEWVSRERGHVSNTLACGKQLRIEQSLQSRDMNNKYEAGDFDSDA